MLHFIRHSFLGGIATRTGLVMGLVALLAAGGFFALLWFGLAIYAAVAIGVLFVLLAAALTHRLVFSRMPSVLKNIWIFGGESILSSGMEFIRAKLWNPDVWYPVKILSSIFAFLLLISCIVLYLSVAIMISIVLILSIFNLIAVPLAILLAPLLMVFLASPISLGFVVWLAVIFSLVCLVGFVFLALSELLGGGLDNHWTERVGWFFVGMGGCPLGVIAILIPTGFFAVYLLPSLISALTFTMPVWAAYVGIPLLFGLALYGILLYSRQAVLDFRLKSLVESKAVDISIDSIKGLLAQGAQYPVYVGALGKSFPRSSLGIFIQVLWPSGFTNISNLSLVSFESSFGLLTTSLKYDQSQMTLPYYQGYSIQELMTKTDQRAQELRPVALVKLLFKCATKDSTFYAQIKGHVLKDMVARFVRQSSLNNPKRLKRLKGWSCQIMLLPPSEEDIRHVKSGDYVIFEQLAEAWYVHVCDLEKNYSRSEITDSAQIQQLSSMLSNDPKQDKFELKEINHLKHAEEIALLFGKATPSKQRGPHSFFYRNSKGDWYVQYSGTYTKVSDDVLTALLNEGSFYENATDVPQYAWTQAAQDMLYYVVKSRLLSEEDLHDLLIDCSNETRGWFFSEATLNEEKKAALKALIESFKVDEKGIARILMDDKDQSPSFPNPIAQTILSYLAAPNPDKRSSSASSNPRTSAPRSPG